MASKLLLYFDDTGSRNPDAPALFPLPRRDGMDCFGLGGILIREEDVPEILHQYRMFCQTWRLVDPLHSSSIRCGRGPFAWLKKPEKAALFLPALENFILGLPIIVVGCVIDRQGYVARYQDVYCSSLWLMSQTAFCVLVERCAKFADRQNRKLEIYFEEAGKKEDRDIVAHMKALKQEGNPFNAGSSGIYSPFTAQDYSRVVLGSPMRKTKKVPMLQIADMVLYPIAKAAYDPDYMPYRRLKEAGKLIDCHLAQDDVKELGIKYSCFDNKTRE